MISSTSARGVEPGRARAPLRRVVVKLRVRQLDRGQVHVDRGRSLPGRAPAMHAPCGRTPRARAGRAPRSGRSPRPAARTRPGSRRPRRDGSSAPAPRPPPRRPLASATIGWYSTTTSPRSIAAWSSSFRPCRFRHGVAHLEVEDLVAALAGLLGLVHREVGVADQLVGAAAVRGGGDADAEVDGDQSRSAASTGSCERLA